MQRLGGSIALALKGARLGAQLLRVHDVAETVQALRVWRGPAGSGAGRGLTIAAPSRRELGALLAILLVAAAIRIVTADYPLWFDELASLVFAGEPLHRLWSGWMVRETNPPLYYSLLRGWIALFGDADRTLRLLSILIGLTGIAAAWAIARRIGGATAGLVAAALLAVSAAHVDVSQQVRGYALADTAALVAMLGMVRFLDDRRVVDLLVYAIAALVALYAHTTMIVFVALANLAMMVLLARHRGAWQSWLAANAIVAFGWVWWGWITFVQATAARSSIGWIAKPDAASTIAIAEQAYLPSYLANGGVASHLLLAFLLIGVAVVAWRDRRPAVIALAILALGAPVVLFAVSQLKPIFLVRTLYWASNPAWILVACALAGLAPRRLSISAIALQLAFEAAMLVHWLPARALEAWPQTLKAVAQFSPNGVLLVEGDAMALAANHYRPIAPGIRIIVLNPSRNEGDSWGDGLFAGPHVNDAGAAALLQQEGRIFTLTRADHDPGRLLRHFGQGRLLGAASDEGQPWLTLWTSEASRGAPLASEPQAALSMPSSPSLRYSVERPIPSRRATSVMRPR